MPTAHEKYSKAIELYRTTDLSLEEISRLCNVTRSGLSDYIYRCQRALLLEHNGLTGDTDKPIRKNKGQRPETRVKYRAAIEACDSMDYLHLNVSQIAQMFHLSGPALANQLRTHYPDIIPRREKERKKQGLADNIHRGVRKDAIECYAEAATMLRSSNITIKEVAKRCNVSFSGLRQHLLFYHKDIVEVREGKRKLGKEKPKIGEISGNGEIRELPKEIEEKYAVSVELYRTTSLPITEIAKKTNVNLSSLKENLRLWHRKLMFDRRGAPMPRDISDRPTFGNTKRYNRAAAEKYAAAIELLKTTDLSTESVAKKFGYIPEVFRSYLKEHEPELYESLGMITLPNGRHVLKRSYNKYAKAIEIYANTTESLKDIAARYGLSYNSIGGFIRRNLPELIEARKSK